MIESKLKVKNCNRGQLLRLYWLYWVSSARCSNLYEVFSWSTGIHILTKCRWWDLRWNLPIGQCHMLSEFQASLPFAPSETRLKFILCHMQNAWQGTIGKMAIRKLRTDTNCPAGKSWPNHVKNEQHIRSEKTYGPKKYWKVNIMVQRTANRQYFRLRSFAS